MARKPKGRTLGPAYEFYSAYIWYNNKIYHPGDTLIAPAGATLTARAFVNNTNNTAGTACYYIKWGGQIRCWKKKYISAGAWEEKMPDCTFSMPSSDKDAVIECGSYEGGTCYYHDSAGTIHLKVKTTKPCSVSTDEDEYYQGDTVAISYKNAPPNSTLYIGAYPSGIPGKSWTVSGTGGKVYTIPDDATTGTWQVSLYDTDCSRTEYITVSAKSTCNQSFRVIEEDTGARVSQSVVIVREKGTAKELGRCTTDSNGECTVKDIEEGVWCVAEASAPSGYEVISDSSTEFVACTSLKTLKLRSTTCKQRVKVIEPSGKPIKGATVAIDMGTYSIQCEKPDGSGYGTDANGECDLCNLDKGTVYTACASKEGYESYGSESCKLFTACYGWALILKLKKIPPAKLEIVEAFYSIDNGITFWGLKENSTIDLGDCKRPLFKLIVKNTGGLPSYRRCLWLRKGTGCSSGNTVGIETSTTTLNKDELETIFLSCDVDMEYGKDYSFHIKDGQIIQGCPSDDELDFKTETRRPYEIRITVKDEKGHGIKHAYVSVTKEIFEGTWQEVPCSDITVHQGICTTESWNGYGNLLKTDDNGVLSIGLPSLPGAACRYGFIAGKPGYLNEEMHEDWTKPVTTRRQGENGEGTYEFEFTLRFITEEDKFIVHTRGFKTGDQILCKKAYGWARCFLSTPDAVPIFKSPDSYPDGKAVFTKADGLVEGETYGIGPSVSKGYLPTGPVWCGKFEGTKEIYLYSRYGVFGEACELVGIPKDSDECRRFWGDMLDPVYCANVISGVFRGKDIYGAEYHPDAFDLAMFPIVVVCSLLPMVPGGNITKYLGKVIRKGSKYGDDVAAVRNFIEEDPQRFYRTLVYGDEARLNLWIKAIADGDIEKARGLGEDILNNPAIKDSEAISKFNQWLDELEKQIDNIDPAHPDYAKVVADIRDNVREAAGELLAYIGDDDLVRGSGERLAKLLNDNWDGAFKLARRAKPKYHFFESFEIVKHGKSLDGTPMTPAMHDYALVLTAFNKANKLGKFSKTGLLLSEAAAYSKEAIRKAVFEAFSEDRFWHFWRVARPEEKEKYIKHLVKGELAEASVMLDDAAIIRISARDVSDYADEIDDTLAYIDLERLENMIEESLSHQSYREALEELSLFPDEYAKLLDEAYPAYIYTLRYGDRAKNITVFIKAADALCSPSAWHCKFSAINSLNKLVRGEEELDLPELTKVLYAQGITSPKHPLFPQLWKALAHTDETRLRRINQALRAKDWDRVITELNELPEIDVEPSVRLQFFNDVKEHLSKHYTEKRWNEIFVATGANREEIEEIARVAENHIQWYHFTKTDDSLENLMINTIRNAIRAEAVSDPGRLAIRFLSYYNPEVMFKTVRKLSDEEFARYFAKLGGKVTDTGEIVGPAEAKLAYRFRTITDEELDAIRNNVGFDLDTALMNIVRSICIETDTPIPRGSFRGGWNQLASSLIDQFDEWGKRAGSERTRPTRIIAEMDMLADDFKKSGFYPGVRDKAIDCVSKDFGISRAKAAMLVDQKFSSYAKELIRDAATYLKKPWIAGPLALSAIGLYIGWGMTHAWALIEELPQNWPIMIQGYIKDEQWQPAEQELLAYSEWIKDTKAWVNSLFGRAFYGIYWKFAMSCLEFHDRSRKMLAARVYKVPPHLKEDECEFYTHVCDVIDGDTIHTGLTQEELKKRWDTYQKFLEGLKKAPDMEPGIPVYATIRLTGYNAPDKGAIAGHYVSCRIEVENAPNTETCRDVTKWAYDEATMWLFSTIDGADVKVYVDPLDQLDKYYRILGTIYYGTRNICLEAVRNGVGEVFFYHSNKYVDTKEFLNAEKRAKEEKLIVWNPKAYVCPATGAWFSYYSGARESVRVGTPTTFEGHAKGCADSEITDWEWTFPHDVKKTGRVVTHTFTEAGSYEIHLKICAGTIDEHRTVTVSRAYEYRESPCSNYGNVNNDPNNYVTDEDAKLVMDYVELGWNAIKDKVGGLSESEFKERADVNGDGKVTRDDADMIYEYYAGSDTGRDTFPACPGAPPGVDHVKIIGPTTVSVGETVTLTGMAHTEAPYKIVSWTWTITDPDGAVTTKTGKTITITFDKVGVWGIRLEACNDATPPNCGTTTQKITVSTPKPPEGELTVATYDTITFTTPRNVAAFFIDGADKGGGYAVTAKLPAGTHTVEIAGKEGEYDYCYVNILDKCFSPCKFHVDVKANETTVAKVCRATYIYLSAYSGSDGYNINAKFYYKPYDIPNATYKEIATGGLIPFGRHYIKAVASGYETLEMIISVSDSGIRCEYALSQGAVCYGSTPSTPGAHGLYSRNFIVKMYLKKAAVTKTVRFESVPGDATITVID